MDELYICCICGEEHEKDDVHHIDVKDKPKDICKECVTSIKGII